jgi:uncharacterized protein
MAKIRIREEAVEPLYSGADSAHDFGHILRVTRIAEWLATAEGADVEIVRAAALLHDIARAEEDHGAAPLDHAEQSAAQAASWLVEQGWDTESASQVADAIRSHRFRGGRTADSLEAKILFDADKLDAIGAVGVARAFAVAGSLNQKLFAGLESASGTEATRNQHNAEHSPVAEFHVKLSRLHERFHTESARRIAAGRHAFMTEFFERLEKEVEGEQ